MAALAPEIELAMAGDVALIEMEAEFHQLAHPPRAFFTTISTAPESRDLLPLRGYRGCGGRRNLRRACHASDAASVPRRCLNRPLALGHDGDSTVFRRLDREGQAGNAAPDDDKVELPHPRRMLSISRVRAKEDRNRQQAARFDREARAADRRRRQSRRNQSGRGERIRSFA